jgi:hypothetical protein
MTPTSFLYGIEVGPAMWGSDIRGLAVEGPRGCAEATAEDDGRPGVGPAITLLLMLAAVAGLALLPVLVGIGILMGRTVTPGLAIGFGVSVLAGIKFLAFGFGLSGAVLSRRVDTSTE